jgi:uncharacterized protein (TIGR03032 family)
VSKEPAPPFSCSYSPNIPELLNQLGCTIALSTYQAGKLVFLSAKDDEKLMQLPRTFVRAMAIGIDNNKMAIATRDGVIVLVNEPTLAPRYPKQPDTYDSFYAPRATYYTGRVDIHGLDWGKDGLWAVITSFSCLALIDDTYSFTPRWRPPFITELTAEDRCHLNGVVMSEGSPLYVTTLGTGDGPQSWRESLPGGGALIHVPSNTMLMEHLSMPHSPRLYDGCLYMLLSATGEVVRVDPKQRTYETVNKIEGFVRGMARCGDYLFIGRSRLRKNASTFKDLPIAEKALTSGVTVLHLPTGAIVGSIKFESSVDEIYDVQILPGMTRPGIINTESETYTLALTTPHATYWGALEKEH